MKIGNQRGMTIIEIMIGMALGIVLTAGIIQVLVGSKQSYTTQQAVARIQENGRLALEYLTRDVRQVGYMGCMTGKTISSTNFLNLLNSSDYQFMYDVVIEGFDNATSIPSKLGTFGSIPLVSGTDILVVRVPAGTELAVSATHTTDANLAVNHNASQTVPNACPGNKGSDKSSYSGLCDGDILMVTSCTRAVVFQATNTQPKTGATSVDLIVHSNDSNPAPGNRCSSWGGSGCGDVKPDVNPGDQVMKLSMYTYFIGTSARTGRSGLFKRYGTAAPVEIIEDVQSMAITYGVDSGTDRTPDSFVVASGVTDWTKVVAVRIQLLLETPETDVLPTAQTGLTFNGQTVTTTDKRMRQVFATTIGIRNRAPQ